MPVRQRDNKWYWGSKGPFNSRKKARKVAQAAHASGYVAKLFNFTKAEEGIKGIKGIGDTSSDRPKDDVPEDFREYASPEEIKRLGLRPHTGVDEGTFYDTRELKAGQYAAATGEKNTIDELREAGDEGKITLDDLGIKFEDSGLSTEHSRTGEEIDLNRSGFGLNPVQNRRDMLHAITNRRYDDGTVAGMARRFADNIKTNKHPLRHSAWGGVDRSTTYDSEHYGDWLKAADDKDEWEGAINNAMVRILGRKVDSNELMSDLQGELRANSEQRVKDGLLQLEQLDALQDEIEAFKIQRGINRIGLKRGEKIVSASPENQERAKRFEEENKGLSKEEALTFKSPLGKYLAKTQERDAMANNYDHVSNALILIQDAHNGVDSDDVDYARSYFMDIAFKKGHSGEAMEKRITPEKLQQFVDEVQRMANYTTRDLPEFVTVYRGNKSEWEKGDPKAKEASVKIAEQRYSTGQTVPVSVQKHTAKEFATSAGNRRGQLHEFLIHRDDIISDMRSSILREGELLISSDAWKKAIKHSSYKASGVDPKDGTHDQFFFHWHHRDKHRAKMNPASPHYSDSYAKEQYHYQRTYLDSLKDPAHSFHKLPKDLRDTITASAKRDIKESKKYPWLKAPATEKVGDKASTVKPRVDPDTVVTPRVGADTRFLELAAAQRGEAERLGTSAMSDAGGSGIRQFLTEAIGDVIHRMSRQHPDDYSATVEKVKRGIKELSSKYGFTKDLEEQTRSSYDYGVEKGKITESFKAYKARILDIQSQYAVAHSKLPVINQAHRDAQEAAVAFGEQRYEDSLAALRRIESHLGSKEAFDAYRLKGAQPLSDKASKEVDKSLYKLADDPLSKLLDFVILSKAPPFQVTPEGEVTPIKPIEGLGSQDSEREDYEGKEITTRKYIKDPEDAPEVNGEKVKVYTGPKVGHFYDYSQLSSTEHKDEFAQIVAEALDKLEQGVNEMVEANPELKDIFGADPWVNIRRIESLQSEVQGDIFRIAMSAVEKQFPRGTDTPASNAAFLRERTKALNENPKLEEDYIKAREKATKAYRLLLRTDKGNPYSETKQIEGARERFNELQDNYLTALIHSLLGKIEYHGGENHLPTNPNVKILSIQDSHQLYILPKVENLVNLRSNELFTTTDRKLLARETDPLGDGGGWNGFIRKASPAALFKVRQIYSEVVNQWLGVNVREKNIRSNVENGIAMSEATLTRGILPPNRFYKRSKYTVRPQAIKDFRGTVIHELIHSGTSDEAAEFLNKIIHDKFTWLDHVSRGVRGKFIPDIPFTNSKKRWDDGTNDQYFTLVHQNNKQFFNEFPTEILAQRIASERYQPDAKDVDGEDWSKKKIGYSGHGMEQFSVWLLKFAQHDLKMSSREAKTPEGKAKIAKASRDICTELLDWQNMKINRRTVLSGSFASYARKHDNIHEDQSGRPLREHYKNEFAYHVGVNPVAYPDLARYKFSEAVIDDDGIQTPATIPTFSAKKTDEFGSGLDKRALRRIILG